jgi:hypothetical protein
MVVAVDTVAKPVGAVSAVGTIGAEASDGAEDVPLPLGVTTKVYAVPFVRPVTVQFCEPVGATELLAIVQLRPPGVDVAT